MQHPATVAAPEVPAAAAAMERDGGRQQVPDKILSTVPLATETSELVREMASRWVSKRIELCIKGDPQAFATLYSSGEDARECEAVKTLLTNAGAGQATTEAQKALVARAILEEWGKVISENVTPLTPPNALQSLHLAIRAEIDQPGGLELGQHLTLKDLLTIGADCSRQPATQAAFGSIFIPQLGAALEADAGAARFIASFISNEPSQRALDYVHYLFAVGANMRGMNTEPTRIAGVLSEISKEHRSGLVSLRAQLAAEALGKTDGAVLLSPVKMSDTLHRVRLQLSGDQNGASQSISPTGFFFKDFCARRIAPDAIGAFDSSGFCHAYAAATLSQAEHRPHGWRDRFHYLLTKARELFEPSDGKSPEQLDFVQAARFLSDSRINPFSSTPQASDHALELAHLHHPSVQTFFKAYLNVDIAALPLRTQLHLVWYLEQKGREGFDQLAGVVSRASTDSSYAQSLVSALLITANGLEWGDSLISICSKLSVGSGLKVCQKIQEIASSIDEIDGYVRKSTSAALSEEDLRTLRQNLLSRTCAVVTGVASHTLVDEVLHATEDSILNSLERAKREVYLFGETCRKTKIDPAQLKGSRVTIAAGPELSPERRQLLSDISLERSIATYGERGAQLPFGEFQKALSDPSTTFYILEVEGSPVAFMRASPLKKVGTIYLGSLNGDRWYEGYRFGMALFDRVIDLIGKDYTLEGFVHKDNTGPRRYYISKGFRECEEEIGPDGQPTGYIRNERVAANRLVK